jgi:hypothetical protein
MFWVYALLAIAALRDTSSLHRPGAVCATKADQTALAAHSKANSFAPHAGAHSRVYGAPIQSRIFRSHPRKNPQLKSTGLPDA